MIESSLYAEYQAKHYIKDWQTFYKKPEGIKKKQNQRVNISAPWAMSLSWVLSSATVA